MKLVAIHSIERGRSADPSRVAPGELFDATENEVQQLLPMRAAREATEQDIALADARAAARAPRQPLRPEVIAPVATSTPTERELLEAKATELGVKFSANIGDEGLAKRINEAERKALEERATKVNVEFDKDTTSEDLETRVAAAENAGDNLV